ncbi:DUF302 domain-containing protein [Salinisphaera hydrothermalis]|uniref:DUF302 domain-containing protein n=1 Tax=Salinisphaera hydrothermalis (strain C41B8) TaxID=1304275 RepID=A0A084IQ00_SALHC|nr:DUF302 domain-containing protein [Salinisphaera hydrothermalis]KEZ78784.1 hypothetical protein C41B8_04176 [Salinisphaera hydrothermalis C41B8]
MNTRRARWPLTGLLLLSVALAGCDIDWIEVFGGHHNHNDNTSKVSKTNVPGLDVAQSDYRFTQAYDNLAQAVDGNNNYYKTLKVDLQAEASAAGRDIRPTRVILFDDPARITPIIAADRRAGLDLPPAMLVYQTRNDASAQNVGVAYNSSDYLAARYNVSDAQDALDGLASDLDSLVRDASGNSASRIGAVGSISRGEGIVDRTSNHDFNTTLDRLVGAINDNSDLELLQQWDHRAAAHSIGSMLDANDDPSTLVIVNAGADQARMIAGGQTVAVDLPVRILVSEDTNGTVHVDYDKPSYLADRHHVDASNAVDDLDSTVRSLVNKAIN